jgi:hypothetical protein
MCVDGDPTPAEWAPPLRSRAADNTDVIALRTYTIPRQGQLRHELYMKQYRGDAMVERIWAAVPKLTFTGELNKFLRIGVDLEGLDWERSFQDSGGVRTRAWRGKRPTVAPFKIAGGRVLWYAPVGGGTYADLALKSFSVALNERYAVAEEAGAPQGVLGHRFVGAGPTGTFTGDLDTSAVNKTANLIEAYAPGTELSYLLIQVGSRMGRPGVWAFWAYKVQITDASINDDGGKISVTASWKVDDHDTDTSGLPASAFGMG